jgi:ubiquitin-protein ligase
VDPAIRAVLLASTNGAEDLGDWTVIFAGKEYTSLEGGNYKLRVKAGENYPSDPPEVWVLDGFEHFHVFAGGKVCFKLLNKDNWKLGYSILILVNGIIKMLHSDPEVSDPASITLPRLVERGESKYHQPNFKKYNTFLAEQAKRFAHRY